MANVLNDGSQGNVASTTIDSSPITARHLTIFFLCALAALLDGWDSQSIGIVGPLLRDSLQLNSLQLGSVFSVGQLGATLGALAFGPLADRFGRKPLLLVAMGVTAVFTYATAHSAGYSDLVALRFMAGVGLGGAVPCIIALVSEFAPKKARGAVVTLVFAAYPIGGALGGLVNAWMAKAYGWRTVFQLGGVLPILLCIATYFLVRESPLFLASRGYALRAAEVLRWIGVSAVAPLAAAIKADGTSSRVPLSLLFVSGRWLTTIALLAVYFFAFATTKIMVVWLPSLLADSGLVLSTAAMALAAFNVGAALGMAISGTLVDKLGAGKVLAPALVIASVSMLLLGVFLGHAAAVHLLCLSIGTFTGIGAAGAHAVAVRVYEPAIRSSGVGLGIASSRFGQVASPMLVGAMLGAGAGVGAGGAVFPVLAALPLLAAISAFVLMSIRSKSDSRTA